MASSCETQYGLGMFAASVGVILLKLMWKNDQVRSEEMTPRARTIHRGSLLNNRSRNSQSSFNSNAPITPPSATNVAYVDQYMAEEFKSPRHQVSHSIGDNHSDFNELISDSMLQQAVLMNKSEIPLPYRDLENLIMNYDLDPYEYSDGELMDCIVAMFYMYDIPKAMNISLNALLEFLKLVHQSYKPPEEVIFHNFKHVYNVFHLTFHLLLNGVDAKLTKFDVSALFIAALCHDIDHPGVNNSFMINSNSDMAKLYSNDSVLERHHAYKTRQLLSIGINRKSADKLDYCSSAEQNMKLLWHMSDRLREQFKNIISDAILATDMSHHFEKVEFFNERSQENIPFDIATRSTDESRRDLLCCILHAADIGAQSQRTDLAVKWGRTVGREFSAQYETEKKLGITLSLFMADLDDEGKLALLQSGFIANIVLPLWSAVADCFPKIQPRVSMLQQNFEFYSSIVKAKELLTRYQRKS